jgi:hypothetical protein
VQSSSRRRFVALAGAALAGLVVPGRVAWARDLVASVDHPTPRPGIDASKVLTAAQLHVPAAAAVFDLVRQIPQVVDGIRCHCGCAQAPGYYSLLSCYEGTGMAQHCEICQGQGRLAHKLHGQGWSLNGIRSAVDAAFADAAAAEPR